MRRLVTSFSSVPYRCITNTIPACSASCTAPSSSLSSWCVATPSRITIPTSHQRTMASSRSSSSINPSRSPLTPAAPAAAAPLPVVVTHYGLASPQRVTLTRSREDRDQRRDGLRDIIDTQMAPFLATQPTPSDLNQVRSIMYYYYYIREITILLAVCTPLHSCHRCCLDA